MPATVVRPLLSFWLIPVVLLLAACGSGNSDDDAAADGSIIVASFDFSESRTLAELYAQALEQNGFPVERAVGVGSRELVEPALEQGAAHFVPEYLGSSLQFLDAMSDVPADTATAHQLLRQEFSARGVTALAPAPAEDKNVVVMTRAKAEELQRSLPADRPPGPLRLSDLAPVASELVLGGPPECPQRPLCLIGLSSTYGLTFKGFRSLGPVGGPGTVEALQNGDVDVGVMLTTSPSLVGEDLVPLVDDRQLQPAENVVPVVRTQVLDRHGPRLAQLIDAVSAQLDTTSVIEMNRAVDVDGQPPARVVKDWLTERRLIGG